MIKQFIPEEICLKCQGCCRFAEERSAWSVKVSGSEKRRFRLKDNFIPLSRAKEGFICSFFLPKENKCKIYPRRPFECRLYPFLINTEGGKVFLAVDLNCPFAKKDLNKPEFKKYAEYLSCILSKSPYAAMLKNNPQLIQQYEGVLNLAELKLKVK
jgi:Fe-S-cluster containining protein